jgi:TnpA family transposase
VRHRLGFRFAPRICDLADKRLCVPGRQADYPALATLIGGTINAKHVHSHGDAILRPTMSIRQDTVTASLMRRQLDGYPRQHGLAVTRRELGRIARSLLALDWL